MKPPTRSRRFLSIFTAALGFAALGFAAAPDAKAQANITFSGGLGTPLVLTLTNTVSYRVNTAVNGMLFFVFQNVLNGGTINQLAGSGSLTYNVNNGAPLLTFTNENRGFTSGAVTANDLYIYGSATSALAVNDTVRLTAGTFTTTKNFAGAPPTSGSFNTFIVNNGANGAAQITQNGVVPEPSTYAMFAAGGILLLWVNRLRRTRQRAMVTA